MYGAGLYRAFPCYAEGHRGTQVLIENEIVYLMGSPNYQILEWRAGGPESEKLRRDHLEYYGLWCNLSPFR